MARTGAPFSSTMVGAIDERGRLPGSTRLATGTPSTWLRNEKSVSSLFRRNPRTMIRDPKAFSMVVVIDSTLPAASTMEMCEVDGSSGDTPSPQSRAWSNSGLPGATSARAMSPDSRAARAARYAGSISPATGTGT
jgi:hypothetical protein